MALPVEILLGLYVGVLTGIVPAIVAGGLGFLFKYFTGVTVPGFGVVALGVAIAGVNGGLLGLYDQTIRSSPTLLTALLVILMMTLYAHHRGDALGAAIPRRVTLESLRRRTLSSDVVERVGGRGRVTVRVAGQVDDLEGYPPLPEDLRATIGAETWPFPADLPVAELERRLADRLLNEYDLADCAVRLDERARASIAAAPPSGALSARVPTGKRAVSVAALLPTGLARGDEVTLTVSDGAGERIVEGTVVSARSSGSTAAEGGVSGRGPVPDGGLETDADEAPLTPAPRAPTTDGGEGRLTVAVDPADARTLLGVDRGRVHVRSRGVRREFELLSLLRQAGSRFAQVTIGADGTLAGTTIGEAAVRETWGVAVLALRHDDPDGGRTWSVVPRGTTRIEAGDACLVVGSREAVAAFEEAVG